MKHNKAEKNTEQIGKSTPDILSPILILTFNKKYVNLCLHIFC